jgi:hypothetical protein
MRTVPLAPLALACSLSLGLFACNVEKKSPAAAPSSTASASVAAAKGDMYGAALDDKTPFVALAEIQKDPKSFAGKRVRTRGEIVAVCQNAGCWADIRTEGGGAPNAIPTHVTMHDHAFLLPKTSKSRVAEVEGTLGVRELSQSECDHYNSEGASLVAGAPVLSVDASGVVLR